MSGCNQIFQGECGAVICLGVPSWLTTTQGLVVVHYCWVSVWKVVRGAAVSGQAGVGACSV